MILISCGVDEYHWNGTGRCTGISFTGTEKLHSCTKFFKTNMSSVISSSISFFTDGRDVSGNPTVYMLLPMKAARGIVRGSVLKLEMIPRRSSSVIPSQCVKSLGEEVRASNVL